MNQKNIFTFITVILAIQGLVFFTMADKVSADAFPSLDDQGKWAVAIVIEVLSVLSILVALITYASRNSPAVLWAYTLGFLLFVAISLKHLLMDDVNVPIPALIIQIVIALLCGYLWMQNRKVGS